MYYYKPYRILVVDDHTMFRQALISLLAMRPEHVNVVGQAENGCRALALTRQFKPDIILLDLALPDYSGIQLISILRDISPDSAILILSASQNSEDIYEATCAGVDGYLTKDLDANTLFEMFDAVASGQIAMTGKVMTLLARQVVLHAEEKRQVENERFCAQFDDVDRAIIRSVAEGATNTIIAQSLCISAHTVKVRLAHILETLDLENRTQLAVFFDSNYSQSMM